MRITHETLLKAAKDSIALRTRLNRDLISVYITGSLLRDDPLLGGTTDIDLVFIHNNRPPQEREIVRLTHEVTLDIQHHDQAEFHQPRHLRLNPWLGTSVYASRYLLYDTQHWFEFTQSSVSSLFDIPENIYGRSRPLADSARQIWLELQPDTDEESLTERPIPSAGDGSDTLSRPASPHNQKLGLFFKALESAVNAIALLSGSPLPTRRFLLEFPERAEAVNRPGLAPGLIDLLGGGSAGYVDTDRMRSWIPDWMAALQAVDGVPDFPADLHPFRRPYYLRACEALLGSQSPFNALWPMLRTWHQASLILPPDSAHAAKWAEVCRTLRLDTEHFENSLSALDAYLDMVEETLDTWARDNGAIE